MTNYLEMSCGCKFKILQEEPLRLDTKLDTNNIPLDCPRTWALLSEGNTKGVFQLESQLGQSLAKQLKPENIEQLAALSAILRPGSSQSMRDGKSVTQHYIDRKNGLEAIDYVHPALESILNETYAELVYQEQAILIVQKLAGFNLQEADILRKAIGHKMADVMIQVEKDFLEGCKKVGLVDEEIAKVIFSGIKSAERYSFNKSVLADTTVITEDNKVKTIDELSIGEYIKCPSFSYPASPKPVINRFAGICKVENKFEHGKQEVWEIELESGKKITCTMQHQFLCRNNSIIPLWMIISSDSKIITIDGPEQLTNIQEVGKKRTVDIEINNYKHLFYANGIATSNSHAVSYAYNGYLSAYCKAHFPRAFFTSYLTHAKEKQKPLVEVSELVRNAKAMNICILPPDVRKLNAQFQLIDKVIYFGLCNVKSIGENLIVRLTQIVKEACKTLDKDINSLTFMDYLLYVFPHSSIKVENNLLSQRATLWYPSS